MNQNSELQKKNSQPKDSPVLLLVLGVSACIVGVIVLYTGTAQVGRIGHHNFYEHRWVKGIPAYLIGLGILGAGLWTINKSRRLKREYAEDSSSQTDPET